MRLLVDNDIRSTVVELNVDTVRALRQEGLVDAVYRDATHPDTLAAAGAASAGISWARPAWHTVPT